MKLIKELRIDCKPSLIRSGAAVPFTGHASPPTITMPRVKAITTGSVPSFLDVVLNFAESDTSSTLANQDTWLAQMRAKPEGKLVMYGDDTWLKLFPGFFERADGTTSFFVSVRSMPDTLSFESTLIPMPRTLRKLITMLQGMCLRNWSRTTGQR